MKKFILIALTLTLLLSACGKEESGKIKIGLICLHDENSTYDKNFIDAMKQNRRIRFSYKSYTRSLPTDGIVLEPYFVKIFKQLWYVIGMNVKDGVVKT